MSVPLNLVVAFCAVIPFLLQSMIPYAFASMRILGAFAMFAGFLAMFGIAAIGEAGYVVCVPGLILACILLPALLLARRLPWRVKVLTAAVEVSAFALMFNTGNKLHQAYLHGAFKNLTI